MDLQPALPCASFIKMVCLPVPAPHHMTYHHAIVAFSILINLGGDAVVGDAEFEHFILDQKPRPTPTVLLDLHTAPLYMQP